MTYTGRNRLADFARGLGALAIFSFLLVGFPVAMYKMCGSPIPDRVPSWDEISTTLMRPDYDNRLFLVTITLIGWGAWVLLVLISLAEMIGYLADRSTTILRGPVRPLQQLIRELVATAALTFSTVASIASSASAATQAHAATGIVAAAVPEPGTPGHQTSGDNGPQQRPTASNSAPLLMEQTSGSPEHEHPWRTHTIERGDTLWDLARRSYGSGVLYPKIFESSRNIAQPDGVPPLTDPDMLHPGQRVRLPRLGEPDVPSSPSRPPHPQPPAHSASPKQDKTSGDRTPAPLRSPSAEAAQSPVTAPPTDHSSSPAPGTPYDQDAGHSPLVISLPSGSRIGLGLAAAVSLAVAFTRLHRRRRHPLTFEPDSVGRAPEPPLPAAALKARQAHMNTYSDRDEPAPSDPDLVREDLKATQPGHLVIGTRGDHAVTVPLAGLSLGLSGDGAHAVARAITTELLAKARRDRVEIVVPHADAQTLFPGDDITAVAAALEGLIIASSTSAATDHLEAELVRRHRVLEMTEQPDVPALRTHDPAEPLSTTLLVATPSAENAATIRTLATRGHRYCIGVLVLGDWPAGTSLNLADDATVTNAYGADAEQFNKAHLFHLTADDAAGMLQTIRTATGFERTQTPPPVATTQPSDIETLADLDEPSTANQVPPPRAATEVREKPARLQVLGAVLLHTANGPITTGVRDYSEKLLAYLALHPKGVIRDQAISVLWPDRTPDSGVIAFNSATTNIRKLLRAGTGLTKPMYLNYIGGRYHIDPNLIEIDLWQLTATLDEAERATSDAERIKALAAVSDLYTGEFASGFESEWAQTHREYLRRTVVNALGRYVQLIHGDDPDRALATLERAITHDPYSEPLYREIMRLQARLGRLDAVQRTYQLLASRLSEIDAEPGKDSRQLLTELRSVSLSTGCRPSKGQGESL
ncbi:LysM peptidoglycan-binding domain-containing protein [Actinomadura sp. LD22]|uniref:LysM peptidoglycan-binding domain-containing protein n=1 Tax=Actinomadura physcomitrii TaxID=2650748 RepID=A0A6I4MFS4_9ACTN|nr:BTAD domain-containing putative transcriptional regulator [Actinomadura physcomitrii]MWA04612.1 LysM peptidoglycan-binding domain-containing protein [Actinomadura physcomitrii]